MTATNQDTSSAIVTTAKSENVYSPAELAAKPTGMKPAIVTSVPASIAIAWVSKCESRGLDLAGALCEAGERRVGRRHRIVDQQRERDDERAKRYPLHVDAEQVP